jgi:hypothetical protein
LFHFVQHGRSPDRKVAGWQDRLTPIQRRVAGGCHLNRPIDQPVRSSGLKLTRLENYYVKGPRPFGYMFERRRHQILTKSVSNSAIGADAPGPAAHPARPLRPPARRQGVSAGTSGAPRA